MLGPLVTVSLGIFGLMGAAFFCLMMGVLLWRPRGPHFPASEGALMVLIPARNEEMSLGKTIASVRVAAKAAGMKVRIIVGADTCSDQTKSVAEQEGAEVLVLECRSKWKTLQSLEKLAEENAWVALVDAGALWPSDLLRELKEEFQRLDLTGIAPAYFPQGASALERLLWAAEAKWKSWENAAGGPVSAHGATVFFRARVLRASLRHLEDRKPGSWLNDDVALAFASRELFPGARFLYWCPKNRNLHVSDMGLKENRSQWARRKRMLVGNFEWLIYLWPSAIFHSPVAAVLAVRRILRIFWAYWLFSLVLGSVWFFLPGIWQSFFVAGAAGILLGALLWLTGKRGLVEAALVSLLSPLFLPTAIRGDAQRWS